MLNVVGAVLQASAQDASTQTISVSQGWNLVALNVQPDDPSLDAIFGDHLEQIYMVKEEAGKIYVPAENIDQITAWETDESYLIYAQAGFDLALSGTSLNPASLPIALEEGWNFIPYLPTVPQATDQALSPIQESLVRVENQEGYWYEPEESGVTLDSLRPGEGYKLYAERSDTLFYSSPRDAITVNTLADALSLQDVGIGQYVRIRGYHMPGDKGGGVFRVDTSGCETDGATCFVFDEDVSAEQQIVTDDGLNGPAYNLPHSNLIWEDLSVQYGEQESESAGIELLHGSAKSNNLDWVNLEDGTVGGDQTPFFIMRRSSHADGDNGDFVIRYKYATSDRRLRRLSVANGTADGINIAWYGATPADPQNPVSNWSEIAWAINRAHQLRVERGLEWAHVDIPGNYYYDRLLRLREGIALRGATHLYENVTTQTFGKAANGDRKSVV